MLVLFISIIDIAYAHSMFNYVEQFEAGFRVQVGASSLTGVVIYICLAKSFQKI
ncbi:MAG: hypothetical protein ACE5GR_06340 [Nitrosopumilus sp.]